MPTSTCPHCDGRRYIDTTVPNVKKSGGVTYVSNNPPTKVRRDVCDHCNGSGVLDDLIATWDRVAAEQLAISDAARS